MVIFKNINQVLNLLFLCIELCSTYACFPYQCLPLYCRIRSDHQPLQELGRYYWKHPIPLSSRPSQVYPMRHSRKRLRLGMSLRPGLEWVQYHMCFPLYSSCRCLLIICPPSFSRLFYESLKWTYSICNLCYLLTTNKCFTSLWIVLF